MGLSNDGQWELSWIFFVSYTLGLPKFQPCHQSDQLSYSSLFISHLPPTSHSIFYAPLLPSRSFSLSVSVSNSLSTSSKTYCFSAFCCFPPPPLSLFLSLSLSFVVSSVPSVFSLRHTAVALLCTFPHPHHLSHSCLLCAPSSLSFVLLLPFCCAHCLLNSPSIAPFGGLSVRPLFLTVFNLSVSPFTPLSCSVY